MELIWHDTDYAAFKFLEFGHNFEKWIVLNPFGDGRGSIEVTTGPSAMPPKMIYDILKIDGIWRLETCEDGFWISIMEAKQWNVIQSQIAEVLARHNQANT